MFSYKAIWDSIILFSVIINKPEIFNTNRQCKKASFVKVFSNIKSSNADINARAFYGLENVLANHVKNIWVYKKFSISIFPFQNNNPDGSILLSESRQGF